MPSRLESEWLTSSTSKGRVATSFHASAHIHYNIDPQRIQLSRKKSSHLTHLLLLQAPRLRKPRYYSKSKKANNAMQPYPKLPTSMKLLDTPSQLCDHIYMRQTRYPSLPPLYSKRSSFSKHVLKLKGSERGIILLIPQSKTPSKVRPPPSSPAAPSLTFNAPSNPSAP